MTLTSDTAFSPDWVSAPGETIADILNERNTSLRDFARQLGLTQKQANQLLTGSTPITLAMARQLENILGASLEFWMSRDFQYRQTTEYTRAMNDNWTANLPVRDMINFGWLRPTPDPSNELSACLNFFDVPSVTAWQSRYSNVYGTAAFRTSKSFDSRPEAVAAWLRQGEIEAEAIECDAWDADRFQLALQKIRPLTRKKNPQLFIPELKRHCAESGVAVVIVRSPNGCRASGATRFLSKEKAVVQLSFRHLTDDHFWFSFFHESGHLIQHNQEHLFLEGFDTKPSTSETEANNFAARILVPDEYQSELAGLPLDAREVIRFAVRIGTSPGIVVGQLQHLKKINRNQLNGLKRRYSW